MCGVVGAIGVAHAASVLSLGLHCVQNRGRTGCGISTIETGGDESHFHCQKFKGTVSQRITDKVLKKLPGSAGIGHTRYPTAANSGGKANLQPLCFFVDGVPYAMVHNGNFPNHRKLEETELFGTPFVSASDTERFLRLILREHRSELSLVESVRKALGKMQGSCSALLHTPGQLIAIRDASGNRPLFWGKKDGGYVVASESCALDALGALPWYEIPPGTITTFTAETEPAMVALHDNTCPVRQCTFELLYFGFPTSQLFGVPVAEFRFALGERMASVCPTDTDLIVGIPDSAVEMAQGYAHAMRGGAADQKVIMRRHDTGRTFTLSGQKMRETAVARKFSINSRLVNGRSVTLVDDSLVRGTTSSEITKALRERGAREVHWRIPSPPIIASCLYGIDTADSSRLLATHLSVEEMREYLGADSLEFLPLSEFQTVVASHGMRAEHGCYSCMTGEYWHETT